MSTANISYGSLRDASSEAKAVAKKLSKYAESLNDCVYRKLNSYSGSYTGNIQKAKHNVNTKIINLRSKSQAYNNYANDLSELKKTCVNTDKAVKSLVSNLTATFKKNNGIKNNKVIDNISYYLTSWGNSNSAFRWLGNAADSFVKFKDYLGQSIEDWWDYEGGKRFIKGLGVGLCEFGIAVCGVLLLPAITGIWSAIVVVAGLVSAGLAIANAFVNMSNEFRALDETWLNGDPALGRRRSDENSIQDTIRRESDSKGLNLLADSIDCIQLVCDTINIADGVKNLGKNGFKFFKEKKVYVKNIFSNLRQNCSISKIGQAIKMNGFSTFKKMMSSLKNNIVYNLTKNFKNFDTIKDVRKTVKNYLGITKSLLNDFSIDNIKETMVTKIVLPCITIFSVNKDEPKIIGFLGKQMQFDFWDRITINDFYKITNSINKNVIKSDLFADSYIDSSVLSKLSSVSDVSISIPEIYIESFEVKIA